MTTYTRIESAGTGRRYVVPDGWAPDGDTDGDGDRVVLRGIGMNDLTTEEYIQMVDSDLEGANYHSLVGLLERVLAKIEPIGLTESELRVVIGAIGNELLNGY